MIPRLASEAAPAPIYATFISELDKIGFEGDIAASTSDRMALATDNSIYRLLPECTLFPKDRGDLVRIARLAGMSRFRDVKLAARGGGTGTNGQSLTNGIVVDVSRHMNRILQIDAEKRLVRVEAGVVKDQLNEALRPLGLFFAPELSTSNRATIGGMVSTDASGQGSCVYGKTRHHVRSLAVVLLGGDVLDAAPLDDDELSRIQAKPDRIGDVHRTVDEVQRRNAAEIDARFPRLNRSLTGYDLAHIRDTEGRFDLTSVLCGSEGTLGLLAEAQLSVLPIPRHSALIVIRYRNFDAALRDARVLMTLAPTSIETIDEKIIDLARSDPLWPDVAAHFPETSGTPIAGVNLVEFCADSEAVIASAIEHTCRLLGETAGGRIGFTTARDDGDIRRIWSLRKKAVGLLGATAGTKRPIPFVEDTAVPPEALADYVAEFRAILDRRGLAYGMFGHVDAGVLHVRPALDMTDPLQRQMIRGISDEIFALSRRHGGVLWGEHGKGIRSEYGPEYFGDLYRCMQQIKAAFDPFDQLNPGKIATRDAAALMTIDKVPFVGERDGAVPPASRRSFGNAFSCNGNGACFDFDFDAVMCPSWKGTRDRRHSPKGRATLIREWLRRLANAGIDPLREAERVRRERRWLSWPRRAANTVLARLGKIDFSHDVKEVLDGCLGCKACAGQCPSKVDVPAFRSSFLELYHDRYLGTPADWLFARIESLLPLAGRMPRLFNAVTQNRPARWLMCQFGVVAIPPMPRVTIETELKRRGVSIATSSVIEALPADERAKSVVIVADAFTSAFDPSVVLDLVDCLCWFGFIPFLAPALANGKPAHFQGELARFERLARHTANALSAIESTGVPLIGIDPAMTLVFRDEYRKMPSVAPVPNIRLVQEWLSGAIETLPGNLLKGAGEGEAFRLAPHCTEMTNAGRSISDWGTLFDAFGLKLEVLRLGCCGMAGTFGHRARHRGLSERIYANSWHDKIAAGDRGRTVLATGYSCRSQAKLIDGIALQHPISALRNVLEMRRGLAVD